MDRLIRFVQVWGVPIGMGGAYAALAWSSETDNTGKAWMTIGFGFVLVIWFVFRLLAHEAALARSVAIGDVPRVLELTERQLRRRRGPARTPFLVIRAHAFEIRGDWPSVLSTLAEADLTGAKPGVRITAATSRIAALVETGELAEARAALDRELVAASEADRDARSTGYIAVRSARGRVLWAEGDPAGASVELDKVVNDIRSTNMQRATAHLYLARIADTAGEATTAARHRAAIAKLVPAEAWIRTRR